MSDRDRTKKLSTPLGRKAKGELAEQAAAEMLTSQGFQIIERNWRCRSGELDIIAEQDNVIHIVEVRSRSSYALRYGTAAESITAHKMKQVRDTAAVYLHQRGKSGANVLFDVVTVLFEQDGTTTLEHIVNAF